MDALIEEMHRSVVYWLTSTYRRNEDRIIAEDESPADALKRSISELSARWLSRFDDMSKQMAEYFTQSVAKRTTAQMQKILKDGGWTVEFKMTPAMRDIADATVSANVALIKSIPQQYLPQVEGIVMRGVQNGRDLKVISEELQSRLGVTKRRAKFIALDQVNKATSAFNRARQIELGIEEAIWLHSHAGKIPRASHVKAGKEKTRFEVAKGWYDPDPKVSRHIQPGELINCRCIGRSVVKGFS